MPGTYQHSFTDEGITALAEGCPELKAVDLGRSPCITDAGVAKLARSCSGLIDLRLSHARITDTGLRKLGKHAKSLRTLMLVGSGRVGNRGISAIARGCNALQHLVVDYTHDVIEEGMKDLATYCPRLRLLHISTSDAGVAHLKSCYQLKELVVTEGCELSDEGLGQLVKNCTSLQTLGLTDCPDITDKGINMLTNLRDLRKLLLSGCCDGVSAEGICSLRVHVPQLDIDTSNLEVDSDSMPNPTHPIARRRQGSSHSKYSKQSSRSKTSTRSTHKTKHESAPVIIVA